MTSVTAVPTVACPRCGTGVPEGNFCGLCGCHLAAGPGPSSQGSEWLRLAAFGAAPSERVLRPHLLSTLFPQLPGQSRRPFLVVGALGAGALLGFALLRMPVAGITVAALGLPLLFALYLRAAGLDTGETRPLLVWAAVIGAGLGVAWVLVGGGLVARTYGIPVSVGVALHHLLGPGVGIAVSGMMLMAVPVVVARLLRRRPGESLDGFAIGALGALAFSATATLTRLAPQFTVGLISPHRPLSGLLVEAVLCALTIPVTAAAAGGLVGMLLWFNHPTADETGDHPRRVLGILLLLTAMAALAHTLLGVVDVLGLTQVWMAAAHLLMAGLVLIVLRAAMHLSLMHEAHDPVRPDEPILCANCEHVVPDMAFCPACGVAARASCRGSRRDRRQSRPQPLAGGPLADGSVSVPEPGERTYPGYAVPSGRYVSGVVQRPRLSWLLTRWGVVVMTVTVVLGGVALLLTPKIAHYMCPPDCGRPPTGTPVMALPRFSAPDFSVAYPGPGAAYRVVTGASGVTATSTAGDGGVLQLFSEPANGRSARDVVKATIRRTHPDARLSYEIPNAMVGYQRGYGEVADDWPQSASAGYQRDRILVMAAVKNDLALIAFATGPYRAFGPDFGPGPPSGANLAIALDMGKYVNSFRWSGDPVR